ncbi:Adenylate kinase 7 [Cichlidogyrus casuarinus]|uniref:Adenylate kinase 7 n=1 Tax=Cichlidogyrus casuarinus TaxID=1844966 RepID=A0ABD2QK25_9PLAT
MSEASDDAELPKEQAKLFINNFLSKFVVTEEGEEAEEEEIEETNREPDDFKEKPLKGFIVSSTLAQQTFKIPSFIDKVLNDDPESAYLEEDFKKRKTLPEYRDRLNAEKMIMKPIKKGKKKLSHYVLGCGALYGKNGLFFKDAILDSWKAAGASELLGEGNNYLPTIHVDDLGK